MANLKDLIRLGLISPGTEIVWQRRVAKVSHSAVIDGNGIITTSDGISHKTPSGAAKHLNKNKPVDGWIAWKLKSNKVSLSELRTEADGRN